jgi:hypothetical protein
MGYLWEGDAECGCSLNGGRCDEHARKMRAISEFISIERDPSAKSLIRIMRLADGYGAPGFFPSGYDWSGIRDSSQEAIEVMYAATQRAPSMCACNDGAIDHFETLNPKVIGVGPCTKCSCQKFEGGAL